NVKFRRRYDEADDDIFEDASSYDGNISYHDENSHNITYPQHVGLNNDLRLQTFRTLDYDNTDINYYQEFEGDIQSTQQQTTFYIDKIISITIQFKPCL
ncbi:13796_t:CDS:1, partial [Funneliformis mosseae]